MLTVAQDRSSVEWSTFNKFVEFSKAEGVVNDSVVSMTRTDPNGSDITLAKSANDKIAKLYRNPELKDANNRVRNVFRQSVLDIFHVNNVDDLPPNVKTAMELEKFDCGKPLSARRIKAVSEAIEQCDQTVNGRRILMTENAANGVKDSFEGLINNMLGQEDGGDSVFGQISSDVYRASNNYLTDDEANAFVANPYGFCECEGTRHGFMLNGKQFPKLGAQTDTTPVRKFANDFLAANAPADRKLANSSELKQLFAHTQAQVGDFVPLSGSDGLKQILHSLAERKFDLDENAKGLLDSYALTHNGDQVAEYKNELIRNIEQEMVGCDLVDDLANDLAGVIVTGEDSAVVVTQKDLKLRNAAIYFCQQAGLSVLDDFTLNGGGNIGGDPGYGREDASVSTVNIIPLPDGKGYDISVSRACKSVTFLKETDGPQLWFNPLYPGEVSAKCVYHVEMDGDRVKVSLKGQPEMRLKLPKPISKEEYRLRSREFLLRNLDDIVALSGHKDIWDGLSSKERGDLINAVADSLKSDLFMEDFPVTAKHVASQFGSAIANRVWIHANV